MPGACEASARAGGTIGGESILICPDNREKIAAAVDAARQRTKPAAAPAPKVTALRKLLDDFLHGATAVGHTTDERAELMLLLEEGERWIGTLSQEVRRKTLIVE